MCASFCRLVGRWVFWLTHSRLTPTALHHGKQRRCVFFGLAVLRHEGGCGAERVGAGRPRLAQTRVILSEHVIPDHFLLHLAPLLRGKPPSSLTRLWLCHFQSDDRHLDAVDLKERCKGAGVHHDGLVAAAVAVVALESHRASAASEVPASPGTSGRGPIGKHSPGTTGVPSLGRWPTRPFPAVAWCGSPWIIITGMPPRHSLKRRTNDHRHICTVGTMLVTCMYGRNHCDAKSVSSGPCHIIIRPENLVGY